MEFLSPWFWLGAALVAVPVLLHLVQRERKNRIPFASLMLMPRLPVKQMRRRRLKHLLLLLLRCLGILLIVAAFTRPLVTGAWFSQFSPIASRSVVILIDNSYSMSRPSVWERALDAAREKIRGLTDADEGMLIQYGEAPEALTPWTSRESLVEALQNRVTVSYAATAYLEALRTAAGQFDEDRNPQKEILWITDLQASGLVSSRGWKVPGEISVEIKDVGEPSSNLFVEEARIDGEVYSKRYPNPILVTVAQSPPGESSGEVQLWVEDQIEARGRFETDTEGRGQVTLDPFELPEGPTRGRIVLTEDDSLPEDNSYHFVIERRRPSQVWIVSDRGGESSFFLRNALSAGSNLPFEVRTTRRLPANLDPDSTALVILDDVVRPPAPADLERFVEAGGGLAVVVGRGLRPQAWDGWDQLLPAAYGERRFVRSRNKAFTSITEVSWDHPIFSVFQDSHRAALAGAQFYSFWELQPRPEATVPASFDDGRPALVEWSRGEGRVLMFAAAADRAWTDFQLRSSYVPFWDQVLGYAAGWKDRPASLRVNQVLAPPAGEGSEEGQSGSWDLIDPRGQRVLGIQGSTGEPLALKLPGIYEVRSNRRTDFVAANLRRRESDLSRARAEDLTAVFVPAESQAGSGEAEVVAARKEKQQSLWWLFLAAGALVLLVESWVANRPKYASRNSRL